jgi:hypothetical protein
VLGDALRHAVQEEADDVVEVAGDDAVGEVPDAVAAQAGVRGERLVGSARGCMAGWLCRLIYNSKRNNSLQI